jgi:hypothetical protein
MLAKRLEKRCIAKIMVVGLVNKSMTKNKKRKENITTDTKTDIEKN